MLLADTTFAGLAAPRPEDGAPSTAFCGVVGWLDPSSELFESPDEPMLSSDTILGSCWPRCRARPGDDDGDGETAAAAAAAAVAAAGEG